MNDGERSAWNSAQYYTEELSILRRKLHESVLHFDLNKRYSCLVAFYHALSARMKKDGEMRKKHADFYIKVTEEYRKERPEWSRLKRVKLDVLELFNQWEKELRYDENALGLLVMSREDPGMALGKGE